MAKLNVKVIREYEEEKPVKFELVILVAAFVVVCSVIAMLFAA